MMTLNLLNDLLEFHLFYNAVQHLKLCSFDIWDSHGGEDEGSKVLRNFGIQLPLYTT